ncbi:MAG: hypothetical protein GF398_19760 [Chitinivibrionales bacterium]|nr:hypothetical protein [Chitinivibrionales bacterium]
MFAPKRMPPTQKWILRQHLYKKAIALLENEFSSIKIPFLLYKGAYLIEVGLARQIRSRNICDIDILVKPNDFARVVHYFEGRDNTVRYQNRWEFERTFDCKLGEHVYAVDIHRGINYDERFEINGDDIFSRAESLSEYKKTPCPEDALSLFICHLFVHFWKSFPKSTFDEIEALSTHPAFNWQRFWKILNQTGMRNFGRLIFSLYEDRVGIKLPGWNSPKIAGRKYYKAYLKIYFGLPESIRKLLLNGLYAKKPVQLALRKFRLVRKTKKLKLHWNQ